LQASSVTKPIGHKLHKFADSIYLKCWRSAEERIRVFLNIYTCNLLYLFLTFYFGNWWYPPYWNKIHSSETYCSDLQCEVQCQSHKKLQTT